MPPTFLIFFEDLKTARKSIFTNGTFSIKDALNPIMIHFNFEKANILLLQSTVSIMGTFLDRWVLKFFLPLLLIGSQALPLLQLPAQNSIKGGNVRNDFFI
jgi:hypothetical protein